MYIILLLSLFLPLGAQAQSFRVGVVDSGIESSHPWLKHRVLIFNEKQQIWLNNTNNLNDENGHGTHVAGIITEIIPEKFNYQIVPFKNIHGHPDKEDLTLDDMGIPKIVDLAVKHKIKILNFSQTIQENYPSMLKAFQKAQKHGIIIVAAAGNGEKFGSTKNHRVNLSALHDAYEIVKKHEPHQMQLNVYPCAYKLSNLICVGNYEKQGWLFPTRVVESNYGTETVHLMAMGENIESSCIHGRICAKSGSSMSAGRVSGELAKLWLKNPQLSAQKIIAKFLDSLPVDKSLVPYSITGKFLD